MQSLNTAIEYAHTHRIDFLENLISLVKIPSISAVPDHKPDLWAAVNWLKTMLHKIGGENIEIFETEGAPILFAEMASEYPGRPTVLIYGHYDVQPPDPLDLWHTPPFTPEKRDSSLYGRGASDMKGQIIAVLSAIEAIRQTSGLPVNLKFLFEGEEEIGSIHLPEFIHNHSELLQCDVVLNPDAGMVSPEVPTIVYALRGLSYFELIIHGPSHDLHSGVFGGVVQNPAIVLAEAIAGMHDDQGRITLPGFYSRVRNIDSEERTELARLPIDAGYFKQQAGVSDLRGEVGFTPVEQVGARPSLDVNGLYSGYTGKGSKTIIPAWAMAKISMRLVPDQDPDEVYTQLKQYIQEKLPPGVTWELNYLGGGAASISDRGHPAVLAFARALKATWGVQPVFKREGGSVPVTGDFQKYLKAESILTGFGLPGDLIHSPNEHLHLPTWEKGIDAIIRFLYSYTEQ